MLDKNLIFYRKITRNWGLIETKTVSLYSGRSQFVYTSHSDH